MPHLDGMTNTGISVMLSDYTGCYWPCPTSTTFFINFFTIFINFNTHKAKKYSFVPPISNGPMNVNIYNYKRKCFEGLKECKNDLSDTNLSKFKKIY